MDIKEMPLATTSLYVSVLLFAISVCIFQSTTARIFLSSEFSKPEIVAVSDASSRKISEEGGSLSDIPIPRRPPGFSIGPSDAGF